uniref:Cytochrome P450 20A1-like n=1 Tax=Saccoglossus kowalevskii TaxID=10224 RepID=A0ABM0MHX3_SACKO|nr:PREDICTED: cytochrome P450 20A1-like [Saccoglossus kowalevskii]
MDNAEDDNTLVCDIITYVVAAYHTSTFMLVWSLYHVASRSDVQEKIYNEVTNVLGSKSNVEPDNYSQLQYTMQVLMESLRWSTLGPFAARVNTEANTTVQGYTIPKNTPIVQALGVVHMDEKIWPEPDRFDPDRFSPTEIKKRHGMSFQPLGFAGQRICPGHRFAYAEGVVFLASICRRLRFQIVEGQNIQRRYGFVTIPDTEIWVTASKRDAM